MKILKDNLQNLIKTNKKKVIVMLLLIIVIIIFFNKELIFNDKETKTNDEPIIINEENNILNSKDYFTNIDEVIAYTNDIFVIKKDNEIMLINSEGEKINEEIIDSENTVTLLYDDYYVIEEKLVDGDTQLTLKRNGKTIASVLKSEQVKENELKLYKDKNDKNAKYVPIINENSSFVLNHNNQNYSSGEVYVGLNQNYNSNQIIYCFSRNFYNLNYSIEYYFYNSVTGEILSSYENSYTEKYLRKYILGDYETGYSFINIEDGILNENVFEDIGEFSQSNIRFNSSLKYVEAKKNGKWGLIDFDGKTKINFEYDSLYAITEDQNYIVMKNEKYGVINIDGKIIVDIEYDYISGNDEIIAMLKNNHLIIMDNELNVLYENDYDVISYDEAIEKCQVDNNPDDIPAPFNIMKNDNGAYMIKSYMRFLDSGCDYDNILNLYDSILITKNKEIINYNYEELEFIRNYSNYYTNQYLSDYFSRDVIENNEFIGYKIINSDGKEIMTINIESQIIKEARENNGSFEFSSNLNYIFDDIIKLEVTYYINDDYKTGKKEIRFFDMKIGKEIEATDILVEKAKKYNYLNLKYQYIIDDNIVIKSLETENIEYKIEGDYIMYLGDDYYSIRNQNLKWYIVELD